jgi:hypothetical protein
VKFISSQTFCPPLLQENVSSLLPADKVFQISESEDSYTASNNIFNVGFLNILCAFSAVILQLKQDGGWSLGVW